MGTIRDQVRKEAEDEAPTFTLDRRVGPFPKPSKRQQLRELAADPEVRSKLAEMRGGASGEQS